MTNLDAWKKRRGIPDTFPKSYDKYLIEAFREECFKRLEHEWYIGCVKCVVNPFCQAADENICTSKDSFASFAKHEVVKITFCKECSFYEEGKCKNGQQRNADHLRYCGKGSKS